MGRGDGLSPNHNLEEAWGPEKHQNGPILVHLSDMHDHLGKTTLLAQRVKRHTRPVAWLAHSLPWIDHVIHTCTIVVLSAYGAPSYC